MDEMDIAEQEMIAGLAQQDGQRRADEIPGHTQHEDREGIEPVP